MISCSARESPERGISWIWRLSCGVVNKSGAWYAYNGEKIGQGRENAKQYLRDNPAVMTDVDRRRYGSTMVCPRTAQGRRRLHRRMHLRMIRNCKTDACDKDRAGDPQQKPDLCG